MQSNDNDVCEAIGVQLKYENKRCLVEDFNI